jgi:hypothetical protein
MIWKIRRSETENGYQVEIEIGDDIYTQVFDTIKEAEDEIDKIISASPNTEVITIQ